MNKWVKVTIHCTYKSARMCIHVHVSLLCHDRDIYKLTRFSITFVFFFSILQSQIPYSAKFWHGNTLLNLANWMAFTNIKIFTQPNSRFTKVTNDSYCKFANIFPCQNSEKIDSPKFTSPKFALSVITKINRLTNNIINRDSGS